MRPIEVGTTGYHRTNGKVAVIRVDASRDRVWFDTEHGSTVERSLDSFRHELTDTPWTSDEARRYEELRAAIDNGNESMTHADALDWVSEQRTLTRFNADELARACVRAGVSDGDYQQLLVELGA